MERVKYRQVDSQTDTDKETYRQRLNKVRIKGKTNLMKERKREKA